MKNKEKYKKKNCIEKEINKMKNERSVKRIGFET